MSASHDPIAFELFRNAIFSIADEMALTVFRTTYSGVLKDNMDYSTAFADAKGRLVAQGLTLPGHLGSIPTALESVMRHFGDCMNEGDVYALNDPFDGGCTCPTSSSSSRSTTRAGGSPSRPPSATTPTWAGALPAPTPRTPRRSMPRGCASRRSSSMVAAFETRR